MGIDLLFLLTAVVTNTILGLVVLGRNPKARSAQIFFILVISIVLWSLSNYFADHATVYNLFLTRFAFVAAIWIALALLAFTFNFPFHRRISHSGVFIYSLAALLLSVFAFSSLVTQGIILRDSGVELMVGPLYLLYPVILVTLFALAIWNLWRGRKGANLVQENQIRFLIYGIGSAAVLGILSNLLLPLLIGSWITSRFGPFLTIFFVGFLSAAIIKHRLFDIRLVMARSVAYTLLVITLASIYGIAAFTVGSLFIPEAAVSYGQQAVNITLAIVLAFTFQPLRRFFEHLTDNIFYRDHYDSEEVLNSITKVLAAEIILDRLLAKSLNKICHNLRIQWGQFFIFEKNKIYKASHFGHLPSHIITQSELEQLNHLVLVGDELENGPAKEAMERHNIRLSLTLKTKEEFVGYLLLGDKLSGGIYSDQDLDLLEILAGELAVAILNAKAYEEIAQFNITLQDKVNRATANLRVANQHLKELDEAKDEFISMASHQLRTPLTTIKGYLSMLKEGDAGKLSSAQTEFAEFALSSSQRMVHLISDLLNVSRMSAGKFMIQSRPTDLTAIVKEEVGQLQAHAQAKNLKLVFQLPTQPLSPVELDADKTREVVMNFIDNAIYYTKQGSVTVKLAADPGKVRLTVSDTGIGVPAKEQAKLFNKFYRAENARGVRPDGTGLGLYLAKRVTEDQGGKIIFESTEGKGSVFGFELPLKPVQAKPREGGTPKLVGAGK